MTLGKNDTSHSDLRPETSISQQMREDSADGRVTGDLVTTKELEEGFASLPNTEKDPTHETKQLKHTSKSKTVGNL